MVVRAFGFERRRRKGLGLRLMSHRLSSSRRDVVAELVRLLTPSFPALDASERDRVQSSVTGFVTSQIESLPTFMGFPYRLVLTGFGWLSVFRFGRVFGSLDEASQQAYLSDWSDGRIGLLRDFIKLIRSCALLAYYDHPEVSRRLPSMSGSVSETASLAGRDDVV